MRRVIVLGMCGSGKSTLATRLATRIGGPHIELDALYHVADWGVRPPDEFRRLVDEATEGAAWVADGIYPEVDDLLWARADTVIWLDYSFRLVMGRLIRRTIHRITTGERVCNGNRLRFTDELRESVILYAARHFASYRQECAAQIAAHPNVCAHRFAAPDELERWLEG